VAGWTIGGHRQFVLPKSAASAPPRSALPLRPRFDPFNSSFGDTADRTEVSCAGFARPDAAVLLSLGQSNSANDSEQESRYRPRGRVFNFNLFDGRCYQAQDPLLGTTGSGGSYLSRLGDLLDGSPAFPSVLLVPIAHGNTWIPDWTPDGIMHPRVLRVLDQLRAADVTVSHILWQQGEAEGSLLDPDIAAYRRDLLAIVGDVRNAGIAAPFYVASSTICNDEPNAAVRAAQLSVVDEGKMIRRGPDTDTIPSIERFDGCHLTATGLDHMARLWRDVLVPAR